MLTHLRVAGVSGALNGIHLPGRRPSPCYKGTHLFIKLRPPGPGLAPPSQLLLAMNSMLRNKRACSAVGKIKWNGLQEGKPLQRSRKDFLDSLYFSACFNRQASPCLGKAGWKEIHANSGHGFSLFCLVYKLQPGCLSRWTLPAHYTQYQQFLLYLAFLESSEYRQVKESFNNIY